MQNLPKKDKKGIGVPNIRNLFIPDEGKIWLSFDLDRADIQVVAWEANDSLLKQMLQEGVDLHAENAKDLHTTRDIAKMGGHLTNYKGTARTLAVQAGITVHDAEAFQNKYLSKFKGIPNWHNRTWKQLKSKHSVSNAFGYTRHYFDRVDMSHTGYSKILCEALAWVPQSTVGLVINKGIANVLENLDWVEFLVQLHDEANFQINDVKNKYDITQAIAVITRFLEYPIPYPDPLIIPVGCSVSSESWGKVKPWENES